MAEHFLFKMPDIGEGVVEGEVIAWIKNEGDSLVKDEPVVIVMTDKATVELPTPYAGTLVKQFYKVGEIAKKDLPIFEVEVESGVVLPHQERKKIEGKANLKTSSKEEATSIPSKPPLGKSRAAPPVRKLAKDMGIPLHLVKGSGKNGLITREDLRAFHDRPPSLQDSHLTTEITHFPGDTESPIRGIQHLMAEKMVESAHLIPHFSFFDQADASRLVKLRDHMKEEALSQGIHLTYMPFFIRALSLVIQKHPVLNSSVEPEKHTLVLHSPHNIGIAMSTPLGLVVPNLKDVEKRSFFDLIYAYYALKDKVKNNQLHPSDMRGGTITITNFGALSQGGVYATPLINYPEVAILGVARIQKQPAVIRDQLIAKEILNCSWSFDHRVIDGDLAAHISADFNALIENPAQLL